MKTVATLLLSFIFMHSLHAQQDFSIQWQRTLGTNIDDAYHHTTSSQASKVITACFDGGYAMISSRPSNPSSTCDRATWTGEHLWLIKFNKYGVTEWEKCYGAQGQSFWLYNEPTTLLQTSDSGFLITGGTSFTDGDFITNHGTYDGFVIKTDSLGVKEWSRCYGGSEVEGFSSVIEDFDGNFVLAGMASSNNGDVSGIHWFGSSGKDAWIVKINPTGNIIWQKCVDYNFNNEQFYSIKQAPDSSYVAVGMLTAKISKNGSVLWQKNESSFDVAIDSSGLIYIVVNDPYRAIIKKMNGNGSLLWSREMFPNVSLAEARRLHLKNDRTLMVLGNSRLTSHVLNGFHMIDMNWNYEDIFLAEIDSSATIKTLKCFGGFNRELPVSFTPSNDNGYLVLATTESNDGDVLQYLGGKDFWLLKVGNFNTIKGKLFYDYNNNALQDAGEDDFTNVLVTSEKNGSVNGWYSTDGRFSYTVDTGALITKPQINLPYYSINPVNLQTAHTSYGHTDSVNFALVPVPGITDLSVNLSAMRIQRPGFENKLYLVIANNGTEVIQTSSVAIVPDHRTTVVSHDSIGFSRSQDTLRWQFSNMEPRQIRTITIDIQNAAPPALTIGDTLKYYIEAKPFALDSSDHDNRDTVRLLVSGSFDPNNKLNDLGGLLYKDRYDNGESFLYTINFQNTGNDTAFTVVIRDTLSTDFDMQSLQMLTASHPYTLTISGTKTEWRFDNIDLVDSIRNEPGSHGYVMFRIKPKRGFGLNKLFTNRASIYFDYNLPVHTNRDTVKIVARPLATPVISGLLPDYCGLPGMVAGKLMNPPPASSGASITILLDNTSLALAVDSSFSFDPSTLTAGNHNITVRYTSGTETTQTLWPFTVTAAGVLDLGMASNMTTVTSLTQTVIITGSNTTGGTNFLYTYSKDRDFTNLFQAESSNNVLNLNPNSLSTGSNMIYGRIRANGQCYTTEENRDSIAIVLSISTGIIDAEAPGQVINIYPVPFKDQIHITGLQSSKNYHLSLLDGNGNVVYKGICRYQNSFSFQTINLPAGVYLLHLKKGNKDLGTLKLVKQ